MGGEGGGLRCCRELLPRLLLLLLQSVFECGRCCVVALPAFTLANLRLVPRVWCVCLPAPPDVCERVPGDAGGTAAAHDRLRHRQVRAAADTRAVPCLVLLRC